MAVILPFNRSGSTNFLSGLGEGLNQLAQTKLQQVNQRAQAGQIAQGLQQLGIPAQQASQIAQLPPELQSIVLKNHLESGQTAGLAEALGFAPAQSMFGGQQNEQQGMAPQQPILPNVGGRQFNPQDQREQGPSDLQSYLGQTAQQPQGQPGIQQPIDNRPQLPGGLKKQDIIKLAEIRRNEEQFNATQKGKQDAQAFKVQQAKQAQIDKNNTPFTSNLDKEVPREERIASIVRDMKALRATGKVPAGVHGTLLNAASSIVGAGPILSDEAQQYTNLANELADLEAGRSGVLTKSKIELTRGRKPNITQSAKAQEFLLNRYLQTSEKILKFNDIKNDLIEENGGFQPANLQKQVEARYKELYGNKDLNNYIEKYQGFGFPDPRDRDKFNPEEDVYEIAGIDYEWKNNKWKAIK